jgi:hypothetical protein
MEQVDSERFRKITSSTLEGLAKRELNLGALLGKSAEARERRLIPEVIEEFWSRRMRCMRLCIRDSSAYRSSETTHATEKHGALLLIHDDAVGDMMRRIPSFDDGSTNRNRLKCS